MSSVFKSPKVTYVTPEPEIVPEVVDDNEITSELEKKRKRRMGAVSQLLAEDRQGEKGKTTLGG